MKIAQEESKARLQAADTDLAVHTSAGVFISILELSNSHLTILIQHQTRRKQTVNWEMELLHIEQ